MERRGSETAEQVIFPCKTHHWCCQGETLSPFTGSANHNEDTGSVCEEIVAEMFRIAWTDSSKRLK